MRLLDCWLDYSNIYSSRTFLALLYVKGYPVTLEKGLKTGRIDSRMMNKYISSIFILNKTVAFFFVKPFYSSISHSDALLSKCNLGPQLQVATHD